MLRYLVITPVRDEEKHVGKTIESMVSQTLLPIEWMIVDDGSSDRTWEIVCMAAEKHPWIRTFHRKDRGFRKNGGGVVEAFYDGFLRTSTAEWDFIVKLDGDLAFNKDYFKSCLERFVADPELGIGGGSICNLVDDVPVLEKNPPFHVRGATKIYRKKTWEDIGGIKRLTGWDTIDELKANMLGWKTETFHDLFLVQQKSTGSADGGWANWVKNGRANYNTGYHPLFMILKVIKRLFQKPYVLGSIGLLYGFFSGYIEHLEPVDDACLIKFVRKQQINRLLFKKSLWKY